MKAQELSEECRMFLSNLTRLRPKHNLTQTQMAKILGIGITSWRSIERGVMPPKLSAAVVYRAADAFGIPAARLFSEMTIN
jgi:transcriptional regulator with XRE-family HTH domain